MRLLAGFCFAGLYVVAESWLNGRATNETRGSLLSIYFVIQTGGTAAGQLLLNLSSPEGVLLFVLVSVLISVSLVPILISASAAPSFGVPERISIGKLFRLSPMGLTGCFLEPAPRWSCGSPTPTPCRPISSRSPKSSHPALMPSC